MVYYQPFITWVNEFVQFFLVQFKLATNYIYMVYNWTLFHVFFIKKLQS